MDDYTDIDDDGLEEEHGFQLEFYSIFEKLPPELHKKLVGLVAEYFLSQLFFSKHLPNGKSGPMVNGEGSVLRDLAAYLYLTTDPLLLDYAISSMGVVRDATTNEIRSIKLFIVSMKTQTEEMLKNRYSASVLPTPFKKEEVSKPKHTTFRDKNENPILSNHLVRYRGEIYSLVLSPVSELHRYTDWKIQNEKNSHWLVDCSWEVEIFETIPEL